MFKSFGQLSSEQEILAAYKIASPQRKVELLYQLAYVKTANAPKKAESLAQRALELSIEQNLPFHQIASHLALATAYLSSGEYGLANLEVNCSGELLNIYPNQKLAILKDFVTGVLNYTNGQIRSALELLTTVDQKLNDLPTDHYLVKQLGVETKAFLSYCWIKANNQSLALENLYGASALADEMVKLNWILADYNLYRCYYSFGRVYMYAKKFDLARDWFCKALDQLPSSSFDNAKALILLIIGESYLNAEQFDRAEESFDTVLSEFERHSYQNPAHHLYLNHFFSIVKRQKEELLQAKLYNSRALKLWTNVKTPHLEEELLFQKGLIDYHLGEKESGLASLHEALEIVRVTGNHFVAQNIHRELAILYEENQEFKDAFRHLRVAHELERTGIETANELAMSAIVRQHEYTQKLKDIEIYQLRNVQLAEKNNKLQEVIGQNQKLLEERTELIRIAVHDLRGPLTAIQLRAKTLLHRVNANANLPVTQGLEAITTAGSKMAILIDRFLTADRIEAGKLNTALRQTDVSEIVTKVVSSLTDEAKTKSISLVNQCEDLQSRITTDPVYLEQILFNLTSNAIKYSYHSSQILISYELSDNCLALSVQDFGQGLSADDLAAIFKRYSRLSSTPTGKESSIGLGLHISQKLALAIGAEISANSPGKGQGSTFTLEIPK